MEVFENYNREINHFTLFLFLKILSFKDFEATFGRLIYIYIYIYRTRRVVFTNDVQGVYFFCNRAMRFLSFRSYRYSQGKHPSLQFDKRNNVFYQISGI